MVNDKSLLFLDIWEKIIYNYNIKILNEVYMDELNAKIYELRKKISGKDRLNSTLIALQEQKISIEKGLEALNTELAIEQKDVEQLEGLNFMAILYSLLGQKSEKLKKEKEDVIKLKSKYSIAEQSLNNINKEIEKLERDLRYINNCEARLDGLLKEKANLLKASNVLNIDEINFIESQIARLENKLLEIDEALIEGRRSLSSIDTVKTYLNNAHRKSHIHPTNMLGDNIDRYISLEDAQKQLDLLPYQLRRFKIELSDIFDNIAIDTILDTVSNMGFIRLSFVLDDSIANLIDSSINHLHTITDQISQAIEKLNSIRTKCEHDLSEYRRQLSKIIENF